MYNKKTGMTTLAVSYFTEITFFNVEKESFSLFLHTFVTDDS